MRIEGAVVVGIDADEPDRALLDWAGEEATARKVGVVVCHVWEWGDVEHSPHLLPDVVTVEPTEAELRIREVVRQLRERFPDVDVSVVFGQGWTHRGGSFRRYPRFVCASWPKAKPSR